MSIYDAIINKFGSPLRTRRIGNRVQYEFNCPFCVSNGKSPDTGGHLSVRSDGLYHCYRCEASGKIRLSGAPLNPDIKILLNEFNDYLMDNVVNDECNQYVIPSLSIESSKTALDYMIDRGFSLDTLNYYNCRVGALGTRYFGRVVIPNRMITPRTTDMLVGRSYLNAGRKYLNPEGSSASNVVFNLHNIPDNPNQIIICEGPLTAMSAGRDAVALYGKNYHNKLPYIVAKNPKEIIVNLDPDAKDVAIKLCNSLKSLNSNISIKLLILPDGTDANDFLKHDAYKEYRALVDSAPEFDSLIMKIKE